MQKALDLQPYIEPKNLEEAKVLCKNLVENIQETHDHYKQQMEFMKQAYLIAMRQLRPTFIPQGILQELFDEAEANQEPDAEPPIEGEEELTPKAKKRSKKKKAIPDHLPRTVVEHDIEEKTCSKDGTELKPMGYDKKEELVYTPAKMEVIEHRYPKYVCKSCEQITREQTLVQIFETYASSNLLAQIAVSKYCDHLPLYRQSQMFSRLGVHMTRQVMGEWMIKLGLALNPLIGIMHEKILESRVVNADETPIRILTKDGVRTSSQAYMWQLSCWGAKPLVLFEFDHTRKKKVALKLLGNYSGYVQVDGYAGYNTLFKEDSGRIRIGCMAHCLRKFKDYLKAIKSKKERASHYAVKICLLIKDIYKIEEQCRELSYEERQAKRLELGAKEKFDVLQEMVAKEREEISKTSPYYTALNYAFNELPLIKRYLDDGQIEIDNNFAENAIRPFALGRRNWLFMGSERGAQASANIYSLLITAKANSIEPYEYLKKIIEALPSCKKLEDYEALLP